MFAEALESKRPAIIDRRYNGIFSQLQYALYAPPAEIRNF
jgi:hypothetical protein